MELPFAVAESSSLESSQTILIRPEGGSSYSSITNNNNNNNSSRQLNQFYYHNNHNQGCIISIDQQSSVASSSSLVTAASHEEEGQVVVVESSSSSNDINEEGHHENNNEVEGSNCSLITASSSSQQSCYIPTPLPLQNNNLNYLQNNPRDTGEIATTTLTPAVYYPTFAVLPTITTPTKSIPSQNRVVSSNTHNNDLAVPATSTPRTLERTTGKPSLSNLPSTPAGNTSSTATVASRMTSMFTQFTSRHIGLGSTSVAIASTTKLQESNNTGGVVSATSSPLKVKSSKYIEKKGQRITASPNSTNSSSYEEFDEDESETNSDTIDFAYVNVTDEDEVDVWIDGSNTTTTTNTGSSLPNHRTSSSKKTGSLLFDRKFIDDDGTTKSEQQQEQKVDVLTILLSGSIQEKHNLLQTIEEDNNGNNNQNPTVAGSMIEFIEQANVASREASNAKMKGNLQFALQMHSESAKFFHDAAKIVIGEYKNASLANSFLLLSQTQAKSAIALKRVLKQQPKVIQTAVTSGGDQQGGSNIMSSTPLINAPLQYKDRLRATLRGALDTHNQREADISESMFLGSARTSAASVNIQHTQHNGPQSNRVAITDTLNNANAASLGKNPVDEMMELERELRAMDMALEMGNSITSLNNARVGNNLRNSISSDGSFMVVPGGSNSYMSNSVIWGNAVTTPSSIQFPTRNTNVNSNPSNNQQHLGPRARANRVQSLGARQQSGSAQIQQQQQNNPQYQQLILPPPSSKSTSQPVQLQANSMHGGGGLESSWWGNNYASASQILSSSVISLAGGDGHGNNSGSNGSNHVSSNNTKQLLRLMDSLKTLGDENAALLREVEDAEAARNEARAAKEQMKRFKEEYAQKFASLKEALDKVRNSNGETMNNPVLTSEYLRSASVSDQIQRQEQLVRKLTADLKREKEESKKKDAALRKYESFYKEVKARSAQKAAQRQGTKLDTTSTNVTTANGNNISKPQIPKPAATQQYQQQQQGSSAQNRVYHRQQPR